MYKWFLVLFLSFSTYAKECDIFDYSNSYKENLPTSHKKEIVKPPIHNGGKLTCHYDLDYTNTSQNELQRIETGSVDGVKYRIFLSDGSGAVQGKASNTLDYIKDKYGTNWSISCRIDKMDDRHRCVMSKGSLRVGIWKDGSPYIGA